jgi:glycosyltransferase involved in cell wall biosynthesis
MNNKELPKISVIVGNHSQRYDVLRKFAVKSLLNSEYPQDKFEIIVIDNNCDKSSFSILKDMFSEDKNVKVVKEGREGICFMRNKGFDFSNGDIIAYIDDDCEVDKGWLKRMSDFYSDRSISFGGGSIYDTEYKRFLRTSKNDPNWPEERRIIGGNMSFRKEVLKKNRFDDNIIYGKDEFELIHRLLKQNLNYYFDEEAINHHRCKSKFRKKMGRSSLGEKNEIFAESYFAIKKDIFDRNYGRKLNYLKYLFNEIVNKSKIKKINNKQSNGLFIVKFKAVAKAYNDLKRLQ